MSESEQQTTMVDGQERYGSESYTARVKWFNRTTGWGFVSLTKSAGVHENDDIFVHWKSLDSGEELYKYLVNGEYVSLNINYTPDGEHSYQATNVSGIDGGPLMCETRHMDSENRRSDDSEGDRPRRHRTSGYHHRGPRERRERDGDWNVVSRGGRSGRREGGNRRRQYSENNA